MQKVFSKIGRAVKRYISEPGYRFLINKDLGFYNSMPDEEYLPRLFEAKMGIKLDLDNPKRFNEKLQWLKLYDRKPEYTVMVDKYAVKKFVSDKIGAAYVIPLIDVWEKFDDIDFDKLPDQFALKATHNSGGLIICKDKSKLDIKKAKKIFDHALKQNYYLTTREWPYKDVPPRILAEKYMEDKDSETLIVYKVFNFNGEPKIIQVIQNDKKSNETIDYFDTDWNLLDLTQNFENSEIPTPKPCCLDEMLRLSGVCSSGIPYVRTDWYVINGKLYFSEFTFFSDAGVERFNPDKWDFVLGDWIKLPDTKESL